MVGRSGLHESQTQEAVEQDHLDILNNVIMDSGYSEQFYCEHWIA